MGNAGETLLRSPFCLAVGMKMTAIKWIGVVAGVMLATAGFAQGAFVLTTSRTPLTTGNFAGKTGVTLFIQNTGGDTNSPTFGSDIIQYQVNLSSTAASPQFFIHTWDGVAHQTATPSANNQADFGWQGFVPGDATRDGQVTLADFSILSLNFGQPNRTWTTADFNNDKQVTLADFSLLSLNFGGPTLTAGSYVRFGTNSQFDSFFILPPTTPSETSQTFTDGQSVPTFGVTALVLSQTQAGLDDSTPTQLAFAVVPAGQPVTFTVAATAHVGNTYNLSITDSGSGISPAAVPEPATIGLLSLGALLLRRSRR